MLARYISIITSPYIVTPIFGLWVVGNYSPSINLFMLWGITFIILAVFLPTIFVYIKIKAGKIADFHVAIKEQRLLPTLVAIVGSLLLALAYKIERAPYELFSLCILLSINGIIFYLITKFWKVSIHSASFVGSVIVVSVFINPYLISLLIFLPIIIWARIQRGSHDLWQGLAAAFIVGIVTLTTFYFLGINFLN